MHYNLKNTYTGINIFSFTYNSMKKKFKYKNISILYIT